MVLVYVASDIFNRETTKSLIHSHTHTHTPLKWKCPILEQDKRWNASGRQECYKYDQPVIIIFFHPLTATTRKKRQKVSRSDSLRQTKLPFASQGAAATVCLPGWLNSKEVTLGCSFLLPAIPLGASHPLYQPAWMPAKTAFVQQNASVSLVIQLHKASVALIAGRSPHACFPKRRPRSNSLFSL